MTLIIAVATPDGVHMSSDFRLTVLDTTGQAAIFTDDEIASKQFDYQAVGWQMKLAFTGLAQLGHIKLRDAIGEAIAATPMKEAPASVEMRIVRAVNRALSHPNVYGLKDDERRLTIVAGITGSGVVPALVVLSNWERLDGRHLSKPLRDLMVTRRRMTTIMVSAYGYQRAMLRADRKYLSALAKRKANAADIRDALATVNATAADRSNGYVSRECMTGTIDGLTVYSTNQSFLKGDPTAAMRPMLGGSEEALEAIRRALKEQYGSLDGLMLNQIVATSGNRNSIRLGPIPSRSQITLSTTGTIEIPWEVEDAVPEPCEPKTGIGIHGIDAVDINVRTDGPVFHRLWELKLFMTRRSGITADRSIRLTLNVHLLPNNHTVTFHYVIPWRWTNDAVEVSVPEMTIPLLGSAGDQEIEFVVAPGGLTLRADAGGRTASKLILARFTLRPLRNSSTRQKSRRWVEGIPST